MKRLRAVVLGSLEVEDGSPGPGRFSILLHVATACGAAGRMFDPDASALFSMGPKADSPRDPYMAPAGLPRLSLSSPQEQVGSVRVASGSVWK